ncbi:hypothetical protein AGMMS49938_01260 [Fibrobacterales bacterium]|nr:hypothetical protein AGMMS49938_01260 [Fibrobacterales bacterium]
MQTVNTISKAAALTIGAFGLASAAGSLWGPSADDFPSLQVQIPDAIKCWQQYPTAEEGNPCYTSTAGWWFGYTDNDASTDVRIEGTYTNFGKGVSISNESDGSSLIDEDGLYIEFATGAAESSAKPAIAGIGFNYKLDDAENRAQDISNRPGYCITYTLSGSALQFELGWDESTYKFDTWYASLPTGNKKNVDLKWEGGTQTATKAGSFGKDAYATGIESQAIETAIKTAYSLKIRLKNGESTGKSAKFTLHQLGWAGECDNSPIINSGKGTLSSSLAMNMVGRNLSFSKLDKAVSVQLVNLQGAVVASQTIAPSKSMNLSNLPTGIYMVRVPELGYTNKVMLK